MSSTNAPLSGRQRAFLLFAYILLSSNSAYDSLDTVSLHEKITQSAAEFFPAVYNANNEHQLLLNILLLVAHFQGGVTDRIRSLTQEYYVIPRTRVFYHHFHMPELTPDREFFRSFRMKRESFAKLHDILYDSLVKQVTTFKKPLTVKHKLSVFLYYAAHGCSLNMLSRSYPMLTLRERGMLTLVMSKM